MGSYKNDWQRQKDEDQRVALERADAAYEALPDAMHANLQIGQEIQKGQQQLIAENMELRLEIINLQYKINVLGSPATIWRERGIGLLLGILASVIAAIIWWQAGQHWPLFQS